MYKYEVILTKEVDVEVNLDEFDIDDIADFLCDHKDDLSAPSLNTLQLTFCNIPRNESLANLRKCIELLKQVVNDLYPNAD